MRRIRISLGVILLAAGIAAVLVLATAGLFTSWLWFQEVGYAAVFLKMITSRLVLGVVGGLLFGGFLLLNLLYANRLKPRMQLVTGDVIEPQVTTPFRVGFLALVAGAAAAWVAGFSLSLQWLVVQRFLNRQPFGLADPIFGRDAGFYVFGLPFYSLVYQYVFSLIVVSIAGAAAVYLLSGGLLSLGQGRLSFHPRAKVHLSVLVGLAFLARAAGYFLEMARLVYSPRGAAFGASYTDIHADLPALKALIALAVVASVVTVVTAARRSARPAVIAFAALVLVSLLLRQGYTTLVQQISVGPDEIAKERQFIEHNIKMTRMAFGLDHVSERDYPAELALTRETLQQNADTIQNIRLWDWRPLKQTYSQLQEIRLYYTFNDVDLDRYFVDGKYRQVMLAAREMNQANLAEQAKTWVNQHLKFTHGYGMVMSPANQVSPQGLPLFYVKDIPPQASTDIKVTRPEVYFGELTREYVIVGTREDEFDYPLGDENAQARYQGKAGIPISSFMRRIAFALKFRNYEIALASAISSESRVMMNRDLMTRLTAIAPFLRYDSDPYLVVNDGRLFWMLDAYTVSSGFPYSEPSPRGFNYIRNSVKIVIDAYEGDTRFYLFDSSDPVVRSYSAIFPGLFRPFDEMPEGLKKHIRYPADLFEVQAAMYTTYHMQDPTVFYNKEDLWSLPAQGKQGGQQPTESYYMIMRLPGEKNPEYVLLTPFTPSKKQNMIAWLAARSDAPNYGQLALFKFPKDKLVYGPSQVDARIDQDADISPKLTLWGQAGSQVLRGNLLVIPINGSILYVEPMYLQSADTKLPELKRIIVNYGDRVVMEETLEKALSAIFGAAERQPGPQPPVGTETVQQLIARAVTLYNEAQQAIRAGDWAAYGNLVRQLGELLRQLENRSR